MNKFLACISMTLLLCICAFSQTKSLNAAETEIKTFANFSNYSAVYDEAKYVTRVEVSFDILEPKTTLQKQFNKFEFKITSLFATDGIDQKPVRNSLCINTQSKKFFFSSNRNLTILLDGENVTLGEADRSTEVKGRKIKENLCWEIDMNLIKDFGKASTINFQIGTINNNINSPNLQFFKDYTKLLQIDAK